MFINLCIQMLYSKFILHILPFYIKMLIFVAIIMFRTLQTTLTEKMFRNSIKIYLNRLWVIQITIWLYYKFKYIFLNDFLILFFLYLFFALFLNFWSLILFTSRHSILFLYTFMFLILYLYLIFNSNFKIC